MGYVGVTGATTDGKDSIVASEMEDDGPYQDWHEVNPPMPAGVDIGTSSVFCSPEGSSVDKPTPQEVAFQLRSYVQRLQERRSLVKILSEPGPTLAPMPTVPRAEAMVQAILGTQSGPALPRLEKTQIQQDLVATRVQMGCGHCQFFLVGQNPLLRLGDQGAKENSPGLGAGIVKENWNWGFEGLIGVCLLGFSFSIDYKSGSPKYPSYGKRWEQRTQSWVCSLA